MTVLDQLFRKYTDRHPDQIAQLPPFRQEATWVVAGEILFELMKSLKEEDGFNYLVDISSVDNFDEDPRFEVVYELCQQAREVVHLRVKTKVDEENPAVPSVSSIWRAADWHEREVYDMMGIKFTGHPDLRRIIMWPGYPYHPLRKDFPLEGRPSEAPDIAFSAKAPLEGGPFVTSPAQHTENREPRARPIEN